MIKPTLVKVLVKLLRETADKFESGNSNLTEDEAVELCGFLCHQAMSKESACLYTGTKRSRFDEKVREGIYPRGRKDKGFTELRWYKDELDAASRKMRE